MEKTHQEETFQMKEDISTLQKENEHLREENRLLREDNARMKSILNNDSSNTSLPPSGDQKGGKPANTYNSRGKTGRKSGGQKGHKGTTLTKADVEENLRNGKYCHRIREIGFTKAVGSSGTLIALAEMCAAMRGDHDSSYLTLSELRQLMPTVRSRDVVGRYTVPGLGKGRADIIVAGGAIAEELMSQFGIERMSISQKGLKQGMQIDHMLSHGYRIFGARDSSVRALAHRCQYDEAHAETVNSNALSVFDQAKSLGLHNMGDGFRSLLSCAAILHDIGEMISYTNHNIMSQVIIENADLVGFSINEIRDMGLIVRFHHKKFPGSKDSRLSSLPKDEALAVRQCAMFLKIADVADRHRNHAVRGIRLSRDSGSVRVELISDVDPCMELWSLEKIRPDFRKLFALDLVPAHSADGGNGGNVNTNVL